MKNYFKFNLSAKKLLPVWIAMILLYFIPYYLVQKKISMISDVETTGIMDTIQKLIAMAPWNALSLILNIVQLGVVFIIIRMSIQALEFKQELFQFNGKAGRFIGWVVAQFLLVIITFGIYYPWFLARMYAYIGKLTKYDDTELEFKGKGSDLFVIILLTLLLPMLIVMAIVAGIAFIGGILKALMDKQDLIADMNPFFIALMIFMGVAVFFIMIPYLYYFYKWVFNFRFKTYQISWQSSFWSAATKIFVELGLTVITLGIYFPMAWLKLYKYFLDLTVATSDTNTSIKKFGYDIEPVDDFLIVWGQILLCMVTLGIYFPWAYTKIMGRIAGKTFVEG